MEAQHQQAADLQREKLRQLLKQKAVQVKTLPLSCAQRRLWLVNQLEEKNASYNIPCHITLRGDIDATLLEKSFKLLLERHDILRTVFVDSEGQPRQKISAESDLALPKIDLTGLDESDRRQKIADTIVEESATIFDLRADRLIRAKLLHSVRADDSTDGKDEYVLIIVLHHIISDGWSMGVLARDLFALYDSQKSSLKNSQKNNSTTLPALSWQYADYTEKQLKWLNSADYQQQMDYWKHHLADLPELALPADYPRPKIKGFSGDNLIGHIDAQLSRNLRALCEQQSVSLNMLLSAVFTLLLQKYTGQADIVFGSPIANRNNIDVENLIGFFVNMLVIRNRVEPSAPFTDFLQQSRDNLFSAYSNQDIPFEHLVDELQPQRDSSRNPLFQVVFAMQNESLPAVELDSLSASRPVIPGYDVSEYGVSASVTRFDLELHCWDDESNIRCSWIYDTALFARTSIETMHRHFEQLLRAVVASPQQPVAALSMLPEEEQLALIGQFADTRSPYPSDKSVCELFEQQAETTPEATALVFDGE
ncbi:MAG TPA: non-ribosomal peptide synthetase, partial [Thiotrichales bacterium]|nr:non-ribosomal peptide synthetase [Thiotrichales bacterium]